MVRLIFSFFAFFSLSWSAHAQAVSPERSEASQVLQAAWGAALVLPEEKQVRLAPTFLEIASLSGDPQLLAFWEQRFGQEMAPINASPDYGWQPAEPILQQGGVEALISLAQRRAAPLSFGRSDALLAAGKRLHATDPASAQRLNEALLDLARTASSFERPILAHAAAELAMTRCDISTFGLAEMSTTAPGNLRYAFWRSRIDGSALDILARVRAIETDKDTREVRRVLEGYRAIQERVYCHARIDQLGGCSIQSIPGL